MNYKSKLKNYFCTANAGIKQPLERSSSNHVWIDKDFFILESFTRLSPLTLSPGFHFWAITLKGKFKGMNFKCQPSCDLQFKMKPQKQKSKIKLCPSLFWQKNANMMAHIFPARTQCCMRCWPWEEKEKRRQFTLSSKKYNCVRLLNYYIVVVNFLLFSWCLFPYSSLNNAFDLLIGYEIQVFLPTCTRRKFNGTQNNHRKYLIMILNN